MIKHVDKYPIYVIFDRESNFYYQIPKYQRAYTWSYWEWDTLYNDLCENDLGYFIGSIICINQGDGINPFMEVIDGQQRLTTISILMAAIYKLMCQFEDNLNEDDRDNIPSIRKSLRSSKSPNQMKLVPQIQDYNLDDYNTIMADVKLRQLPGMKHPYFASRKMNRCFNNYIKKLETDMDKVETADEKVSILLDRYERVKNAMLVKIEVSTHSDAYMLFESLNNRGTPLTAIDLMKNLIMSRAELTGNNPDDCFNQWLLLLKYLSDDYKVQERFFRQYYNAFRNILNKDFPSDEKKKYPLGYVATKSNLLSIYERLIKKDLVGFLNEIVEEGRLYSQIVFPKWPDNQSVLSPKLLELRHIQGAPSYLLILYMMRLKDDLCLTDAIINDVISLLCIFFAHRNVTDYPNTRDLTRIFMDIIMSIEENGYKGEAIRNLIHDTLQQYCIDDANFESKLRGNLYLDNVDVTRYLLCALAEHSMTNETYNNLWERNKSGTFIWTIEHIFPEGENIPQSWVDMIAGGDRKLAEKYLDQYAHTLGNLTMTGYNSSLGNKCFAEKRDRQDKDGKYIGYKNGLSLNLKLATMDSWSIEDIQARTDEIVSQLLVLFKFPE